MVRPEGERQSTSHEATREQLDSQDGKTGKERNQLKDSLTAHFTPAHSRRRPRPSEADKTEPLSIVITEDSKGASKSSDDQHSSPSRRPTATDKLKDALSPNFITSSEKRRCVQPGEFSRLLHGRSPSNKPSTSMISPGSHSVVSDSSFASEIIEAATEAGSERASSLIETVRGPSPSKHLTGTQNETSETPILKNPRKQRSADSSGVDSAQKVRSPGRRKGRSSTKEAEWQSMGVGLRVTQNSASAALFGGPSISTSKNKDEGDGETSAPPSGKRTRTPKLMHSPEAQVRRRRSVVLAASSSSGDDGTTTPTPSTAPKSGNSHASRKGRSKRGMDKNESFSKSEEKEEVDDLDETYEIDPENEALFAKITRQNQEEIDAAMKEMQMEMKSPKDAPRIPKAIRIGRYEVETWYSSPYPSEYAHVPVLFICEFCMKYLRSKDLLSQHALKCSLRHPPGREIYRKNNVSVYEVDGVLSKTYCQNLCLLAKLFLDHKTLYYDEKYCHQQWNLSCIVTLPCYQGQGFGRFLIDFSFLLSRKEGMRGSPEKPLSHLGLLAYASYWRSAILEWVKARRKKDMTKKFDFDELCRETGIRVHDVVNTMEHMGWFSNSDGSSSDQPLTININWPEIEEHWNKEKKNKGRIWIDESALQWTPSTYTPSRHTIRTPRKSISRSPLGSPRRSTSLQKIGGTGSTPNGKSIAAIGATIKKGLGRGSRRPNPKKETKKKDEFTEESTEEDEEMKKLPKKGGRPCQPTINFRPRDHSTDDEGDKSPPKPSGALKSNGTGVAAKKTRSGDKQMKKGGSRGGTGRKKANYEDSPDTSSSATLSSDSEDESFTPGKGARKGSSQKVVNPTTSTSSRGKAPRKPPPRSYPRNKNPPKSPGKVFPQNYGTRRASTSPPKSPTSIPECLSVATSVGTEGTVPMRLDGAPGSPGGGRSMADVGDEADDGGCPPLPGSLPRPPPNPPESDSRKASSRGSTINAGVSGSRAESRHSAKSPQPPVHGMASTTASSAESSSDDSEAGPVSHAISPSPSSSSCSEWRESPRPLGDLFPTQQGPNNDMINMGGIPDAGELAEATVDTISNYEAPPILAPEQSNVVECEPVGGLPPVETLQLTSSESRNLIGMAPQFGPDEDDDAPPNLSPNYSDIKEDIIPEAVAVEAVVTESAMDRPPKAPAMLDHPVEDDRVEDHHIEMTTSVPLNPVQTAAMQLTPQQTLQYPGSAGPMLGQGTPGSVGMCGGAPGSVHQTTPEMQQFMSPPQMQCMQPGSVGSSVHSVGPQLNTSGHDLSGSYPSANIASNPATPLRHQATPTLQQQPPPVQATTPMSAPPASEYVNSNFILVGTSPYGMPLPGPSPLCNLPSQGTPPIAQPIVPSQPPPQTQATQPVKREKKKASNRSSHTTQASTSAAPSTATFAPLPSGSGSFNFNNPLMTPSMFPYPMSGYQPQYGFPQFDPTFANHYGPFYQNPYHQMGQMGGRGASAAQMMNFGQYGAYGHSSMNTGRGTGTARAINNQQAAGSSQMWPQGGGGFAPAPQPPSSFHPDLIWNQNPYFMPNPHNMGGGGGSAGGSAGK
ncbi:unnamed protein product, partial [Mesorhabditis belari]|uniref:histone acetyltransferase n=1 Tax=Mesorhabditis belari TaxID=2138241 RepID=A0AAF3FLT2_9BILA